MFTDPQSITIGGTAIPIPRVSVGDMKSRYRSSNGETSLEIAHSANRRERSVVKVHSTKVGSNPLDTSKNQTFMAEAYLVIDTPLNGVGYSATDTENLVKGLIAWLNVTGNLAKIIGKES